MSILVIIKFSDTEDKVLRIGNTVDLSKIGSKIFYQIQVETETMSNLHNIRNK